MTYFKFMMIKFTKEHIQYLEFIIIHFAQHNTKCYENYMMLTKLDLPALF